MEKLKTLHAVITTVLLGIVSGSFAQTNEGAYWVVEGNIQDPTYTVIHFYDSNHQLIKDERLEGKYLDVRKKKNCRYLNRKLKEVNNERKKNQSCIKEVTRK